MDDMRGDYLSGGDKERPVQLKESRSSFDETFIAINFDLCSLLLALSAYQIWSLRFDISVCYTER